jgi:peptidoglycan/xylan/chitin deacetylase (PgdA/CDA1 family)
MLKWMAAGLALVVALLALAWGGWRLSNSRTHQLVGELLTRVETTDSVVALTFDDGPTAVHTDSVLDLLAEHGARATFFMIGRAMERNPGVVARVVRDRHELGNHSWSHRRMVLKSPGTIRREVERTDSLIRAAGQAGEIFVRPPYGKRLLGLPLYLARRDRPVVLWDLEPDTYHARADDMVGHVLERVRPGSIILLHVEIAGRSQSRSALRRLLPELAARGYRFVTLSELAR